MWHITGVADILRDHFHIVWVYDGFVYELIAHWIGKYGFIVGINTQSM